MRRRDGEIEFDAPQFRGRARMLTAVLGLVAIALLVRSVQLQVFDRQFFVEQARHAPRAQGPDDRPPRHDRRPLRRAARGQLAGGFGVGQPARVRGFGRRHREARGRAQAEPPVAGAARHQQPRPRVPLRRAPPRPGQGRRDPQARDPGRFLRARIQALLPEWRGDGAPARLHQPRRGGLGRPRARLRPLARGQGRREARDPGRPRAGHPGSRGPEGAAAGRGTADEHRPAHPVPGVPRAEGRHARVQRARGHGDRARHRERRSARDGQPALVQPERPHAVRRRAPAQSRGDRHLRAGLEHQALRHGRGARVRQVPLEQHGRRDAVPGRVACHPGPPRPRHDRPRPGARAVVQRRDGEDRAQPRQGADARHAGRARLRQGHGQRISRRVGGAPVERPELAPDQRRDDVLWLRPVRHAAAARAGLCDGRRFRHSPPDHLPPRRRAAGGRARDCPRRSRANWSRCSRAS